MMPTERPEKGRKAVVIGASSGIGLALAKVLAANGYELGLCARRTDRLRELQKEIAGAAHLCFMDLRDLKGAIESLQRLIAEMDGMDLLVVNSGVNPSNPDFHWEPEQEIIQVNTAGFVAMMNEGARYFLGQGRGHLVGISSIAGIRGAARSPAYSASKAFASNYMEGLRYRLQRQNICVTDIRPGFIDTPMLRGRKNIFWMASAEEAGRQIYDVIRAKKQVAYVTKRWAFAAFLYRLVPSFLLAWVYRRIVKD